ncbi:hypothetical protein [Saccharothrix sp.]|uniref:hypothetical protein n=1 Tax=Saccharothrix sp. TaxID=1873460 RepID=UPI0028126D9B|nr:hypothetical protein [Saccharothrix sp.]
MNRIGTAVARVGDGADAALAAVRATPRRVRSALAVRRHRWAGIIASIVALVLYLWAIGDIVIGGRTGAARGSWVEMVPDWTERMFRVRAPYLFEPVLAAHPLPQLTALVSPLNLVLGGLLAALVGLNLAVAGYAARAGSCRRTGYGRLLAALPALLTGLACCVPTLLLVLGSSTAAVVLPVVVPLRILFYPLSLVLLAATLVWGTRRL